MGQHGLERDARGELAALGQPGHSVFEQGGDDKVVVGALAVGCLERQRLLLQGLLEGVRRAVLEGRDNLEERKIKCW